MIVTKHTFSFKKTNVFGGHSVSVVKCFSREGTVYFSEFADLREWCSTRCPWGVVDGGGVWGDRGDCGDGGGGGVLSRGGPCEPWCLRCEASP